MSIKIDKDSANGEIHTFKMKPDKVKVSQRIQQIRADMGLSIAEFGKAIGGVSKSTANSWLRGIAIPPNEIASRIAFIAGTSINWIYWGVDTLDTEFCLSCENLIVKGLCKNCLRAREIEMINLFDMVDSKLFPMTYERKSKVLKVVSEELDEIRNQLDSISF